MNTTIPLSTMRLKTLAMRYARLFRMVETSYKNDRAYIALQRAESAFLTAVVTRGVVSLDDDRSYRPLGVAVYADLLHMNAVAGSDFAHLFRLGTKLLMVSRHWAKEQGV